MDKFGKLNIIPDKETQQIFISGKLKRLPSDLTKGTIRGLEYIHYTVYINDLLVPLSNRLHSLEGDREGQHSISINTQWRICFRFIESDAYDAAGRRPNKKSVCACLRSSAAKEEMVVCPVPGMSRR